jgi:chloramphenicol O-acetyltransferase type B
MHSGTLLRILLLPFGLLLKLIELAVVGSRDLYNKFRFRGSIIDRNCCIDPTTEIEENCHILENCLVWDSTIMRFSYVGRNSMIQHAKIGSFCSIANDVYVGLGTHPLNLFSTSPLFYRVVNTFKFRLIENDYDFAEYKPIEIGHDVWIGARAMVMDGVKVGDGAIIAANAVVTKDVPPFAVVAGIPAKIIRYRYSPEKIEKLLGNRWWLWPLSEIKQRMTYLNDL